METIEEEIKKAMILMVEEIYRMERRLPINPVKFISLKDLEAIESLEKRIVYSYFSEELPPGLEDCRFCNDSDLDCMIFGIYYSKGGKISEYPKSFAALTVPEIFQAFFCEELKDEKIEMNEFDEDSYQLARMLDLRSLNLLKDYINSNM